MHARGREEMRGRRKRLHLSVLINVVLQGRYVSKKFFENNFRGIRLKKKFYSNYKHFCAIPFSPNAPETVIK